MKSLSQGKTGPYVELLQSILKKYGYYTSSVDGIFGPLTEMAVKDFQIDAGLNPDGIVGTKTWANLTPWINGYVIHTINPGDTFYSLSLTYETDIRLIKAANPEVNEYNLTIGENIIIPLAGNFVPTDISYSYPIMEMNINSLLVRFPFLISGSIGNSILRNDIKLIKFGNGQNNVLYNASHHANEWITSVVLMRFLEDLCINYVLEEDISGISPKEIFEKTTIHFIPMVNPDGVNLVTGELTNISGAYQYAERITPDDLPFPEVWAANIRGVDLNSNYPAKWEEAREIKFGLGYDSPGPVEYVGSSPLSEPESKAMAEYTIENNFSLTLSYHTQGEVIFYKFGDFNPEGADELAEIFSSVSGYELSQPGPLSAYAGYKDWFIQSFNRPGFTIECGKGKNPLPVSQFDKIYSDNLGILTTAAVYE